MPKRIRVIGALLVGVGTLPAYAHAQEAPAADGGGRASIETELRALQQARRDLDQAQRELDRKQDEFDGRIAALENKLGMPALPSEHASSDVAPVPAPPGTSPDDQSDYAGSAAETAPARVAQAEAPSKGGLAGFLERKELTGTYDAQAGFVLVDDEHGRLNFSLNTYARYLNESGIDVSYTDSFGRVLPIDRRNEVQLLKVNLTFKGWLLDPKLQYLLFAWTNNANQGEAAQVVLAGFLRYAFNKHFNVSAGIMPLPSTRSTNWSYPKWLRHDNRVMADEFYRGSYSTGIDISGEIIEGLQYRAMLGNNLSTLGVSSKELDNTLDTVSAALWWMPTTGEFGLANGFGDYDYHQKVATLVGVHYTQSTETAQGQPSENDFENSQVRLTDGTLLFSPDPFLTGGKVEQADFKMASVDVGAKYKGFSLEMQWYWRRVDDFRTIGSIPIRKVEDNGFALQASAMPIKDLLQVYASASKIWGANGNPTEFALGVNVYPFRRREVHVNFEAIKLDRSPVGGYSLPMSVGGDGWVFLTDWILAF